MPDNTHSLLKARQKRAELVNAQRFQLSWRGSGESEILPLKALPAVLDLRIQSIRSYLATGHGTFTLERNSPTTGELDILTVTKLASPAKPKPRRGRPPKANRADPRLGDPSNI